jgi:hypothetical protein
MPTGIDKDLENIETKIIDVINEDDNLKLLYKLITLVVEIGFVTAVNVIVHTQWIHSAKRYQEISLLLRCGTF